LQALLNGGYVGAKTLIVAETAREESLTVPSSLSLTDERIYGAAKFWFLTLNA
jgi:16S rRNA (guanine966-N2)-methyltransferase